MKHKFENISVELIDITWSLNQIIDKVKTKTCTVDILIDKHNTVVTLEGFSYETRWEYSDIITWVTNKLKQFEV